MNFYVTIGVRDYIHVVDLASGHVAAVKKLDEKCGFKVSSLLQLNLLQHAFVDSDIRPFIKHVWKKVNC